MAAELGAQSVVVFHHRISSKTVWCYAKPIHASAKKKSTLRAKIPRTVWKSEFLARRYVRRVNLSV